MHRHCGRGQSPAGAGGRVVHLHFTRPAAGGFLARQDVDELGADQVELCRRFATRSDDKFGEPSHGLSPAGLPLTDGAVAWVDCRMETVLEIGDHYLVVGAVSDLGCSDTGLPLVFLRGGYHRAAALPPG